MLVKNILSLIILIICAAGVPAVTSAQQRQVYCCDYVDEAPSFPGGDRALMTFICSNVQYPPRALECGIEGRVICSFVVNTDGKIDNINVVRSVECELDREAVRVIRKMPRWKPGRHNGEAVPVYYILPVNFNLCKPCSR